MTKTDKLLFIIICLLALQGLLMSITNFNLTKIEDRLELIVEIPKEIINDK